MRATERGEGKDFEERAENGKRAEGKGERERGGLCYSIGTSGFGKGNRLQFSGMRKGGKGGGEGIFLRVIDDGGGGKFGGNERGEWRRTKLANFEKSVQRGCTREGVSFSVLFSVRGPFSGREVSIIAHERWQ